MKRTITIDWDDVTFAATVTNHTGKFYNLSPAQIVWTREPEIDHEAEDAAMDGIRRYKAGSEITLSISGNIMDEN